MREMKKRSWRVLISCQMALILICMLISVVWTVNNYNHQIRETYQRENQHAASTWCSLATTRLNAMRDHLYELMLLIYSNNAELGPGTPQMDFELRRKCITSMNDKQSSGGDITFLYIKDTESDLLLFSAVNGRATSEINQAKAWVRAEQMELTSTGNRKWNVVSVGDFDYFSKSFSLGRYIVGALSDLMRYDSSVDIHILGDAVSMLVESEDGLHYVGGENWIDEIWADGVIQTENNMWLTTAPVEIADCSLILVVQQQSVWKALSSSVVVLVATGVIGIVLFLFLMLRTNRSIARPTNELLTATQQIQRGNLEYRITQEADSAEFDALFQNFNAMVAQIQNLRIDAYDRQIRQKQDELSMMRAQIRPHFYLNAITTVSNMTYQDRAEDIREYLKALAKYMRYMMNFQERTIPIHTELEQIQSYLQMQKIRFPNSVDAFVGCSSQVRDVEIPFLLIFTVVENSFKHAMSLYAPLKLLVHCESVQTDSFRGCRIIVEDNGNGFPEEVLNSYGSGKSVPEAKDHIGLSNVIRTLQLLYHREDLLRLSNPPSGGARVEIFIPVQEEDHEVTDL